MNAKDGGFEPANAAATSHKNARAAGFVSNGERSVANEGARVAECALAARIQSYCSRSWSNAHSCGPLIAIAYISL